MEQIIESTHETPAQEDRIQLHPSWKQALLDQFSKDTMIQLRAFLAEQYRLKKTVFPHAKNIFAALNVTPLDQVKVVILGQDPYHGPGQAHGLCFSVMPGIPPPPSLQNIFKEMHSDVGAPISKHGYLMSWAQQGVLLLNSVLTVERGIAGSHHNRGWEPFTDRVIQVINEQCPQTVFILWGSPAQRKAHWVDRAKHLVLEAPHPSPLSAYRGFFGCRHFSKTNSYLEKTGRKPIHWALPA